MKVVFVCLALAALRLCGGTAAEPAPNLAPGSRFTVQFPEMPPTFYALQQKQDVKAQMTVLLPTNYDPGRKHPLLVFLSGGSGGTGVDLGVARSLCEGKDFVCLSVPLFVKDPKAVRELLLNLMVRKDISPGSLPFAGKITTLGGGVLTASQAVASESDTGPWPSRWSTTPWSSNASP